MGRSISSRRAKALLLGPQAYMLALKTLATHGVWMGGTAADEFRASGACQVQMQEGVS